MGHYDIHKDNCPQNAYLRKLYEIFTPTKMNGFTAFWHNFKLMQAVSSPNFHSWIRNQY